MAKNFLYLTGIDSNREILPLDPQKDESVAFFEMKAKSCSEVFTTPDVSNLLRLDLYQKYLDTIEDVLYPGNAKSDDMDTRLPKRQFAHELADDYLEHMIEQSGLQPDIDPPYISRMRSAYEEMSKLVNDAELADISR